MPQTNLQVSPNTTWLRWLLLSASIVAIDQAIKQTIHTLTPYGASYPITSFFNLVHVWNRGAAFSFLADAGGWQRYAFTALGLGVSFMLAWMLRKGVENKMEALAYSMLIGGALGNVIDRITLGFVVDFLDFHWRGWHWPAFNFADIAITAAVVALISSSIFLPRAPEKQSTK